MLDLKFIRENPDLVKKSLSGKGVSPGEIDNLLKLDTERRSLLLEVEQLKAKRNKLSEEVGRAKAIGQSAEGLLEDGKSLSHKIDLIDTKVGEYDKAIEDNVLIIPNIPDEGVPVGPGPSANKIIREWGKKGDFDFAAKDHLTLGESIGWLSMGLGAKVTGSAFPVYMDFGAKLERAMINFMVDLHAKKHGYKEVWPPLLVNRQSMTGTGQLPKFEEDMYRLRDEDCFLIPTAEVPVTNLHRDEILREEDLPLKYVAYSACFRREAGSYGKDTRGLSRVHQFDKIEMVKFVKPETSLEELESLVRDAEEVLQLLELPYRVMLLSTGDLSFAGAKCYDIETWAPASKKWFEVSSCSVFTDFQARRLNIRYKPKDGGKPRFVHTLNGSGVALARTVLCLLENGQKKDGSVTLPKALDPYLK